MAQRRPDWGEAATAALPPYYNQYIAEQKRRQEANLPHQTYTEWKYDDEIPPIVAKDESPMDEGTTAHGKGVQKEASTNPKMEFGDKKVPLQLVPPAASAYIAIGLREGAAKYGAWNFRETPIDLMTYIGAIKRHCDAILEGEWIDPDPIIDPKTGKEITDFPKKPHLAGIMASCAILADQYEAGKLVDNRPVSNKGYYNLMKGSMKK